MEAFFYQLLPRMEVKDEHIVRLVTMKAKTHDTEKIFMNLLNDGIELLVRTKELRRIASEDI